MTIKESLENCLDTIKTKNKMNDIQALKRLKEYIGLEEQRLKIIDEKNKKRITIKVMEKDCLEMIKKHMNIDEVKASETLKEYLKRIYDKDNNINKKDMVYSCYKRLKRITINN